MFYTLPNGGGLLGGTNAIVFHESGLITGITGYFDFLHINGSWHVGNLPTHRWPIYKTDMRIYSNPPFVAQLPDAEFMLFVYTGTNPPANEKVTAANIYPAGNWVAVDMPQADRISGLAGSPMRFPMMPGRHYQLVEVVPPARHQAPMGQWRIQVIANAQHLTGYRLEISIIGSTDTPNIIRLNPTEAVYFVGNRLDFELPLSGGMGRDIFFYSGTTLITLAMGYIAYRVIKKKKHEFAY